MRHATAALKFVTFAVCGYEAYAGFTRRAPTVSQLCGRHRALAPVVIAALAVHLYRKETACPVP